MTLPPTDPTLVAARKAALRTDAPVHPVGDLQAWQSTVVFAPHADDESLGCGGLIALLTDRGQRVRVVFVSNGAMSHANSRKYSYNARAELREREALAACAILGVPEQDVHFMRLPDGAVPRQWHPDFGDIVTGLTDQLNAWQADTLVVPWRRDPHDDHRATWEICRAAADRYRPGVRWIEYPVWMWEATNVVDLPRPEEMVVWQLAVAEQQERKQRAIHAHASQYAGLIDDDPTGFQLQENMLDHFRHPTEVFFEDATKRHRTLTDAYFDTVYANSEDPWNFATSPYERKKYAASLAALPEARYASGLEIGCSIGVLTSLLAQRCDRLLAVDISEAALERARARLAGEVHVSFRRMTLPEEFPDRHFDLVVLSEVGYYWSYGDLDRAIERIGRALNPGGTLLLVHYTPYVPDYPLTGDEVHEAFADQLPDFYAIRSERADRYRLDVWKRKGGAAGASNG
ncbi:Trans-aconitate 2-methyltransferase [Neolewinella maritima]|uniref:Trans-aconitate 2-methyltransferase n=1 Tax=Neolewinella maritima TaxID=1383882 RepID=A0ABN8EZP7_9BACT|nr:PIG-L family deacetylase [Neolewinella maritima]CAH0999426.1 Trans-aconitate 2-methyltransferase [Neolewinella maritima]